MELWTASFHFLLFESYYWMSMCVKFFDLSNIQCSRSKWNTLYVSTYVCTHTAGPWLFSRTRARVLLSFPSTMPTFTVNLVSLEWRVRVPFHPRSKRVYERSGTERDGFAFSFRLFAEILFPRQLSIEVNV